MRGCRHLCPNPISMSSNCWTPNHECRRHTPSVRGTTAASGTGPQIVCRSFEEYAQKVCLPGGLTFFEGLEAMWWEDWCKACCIRGASECFWSLNIDMGSKQWCHHGNCHKTRWSYQAKFARVKKRHSELRFTTAAPSSVRAITSGDDVEKWVAT
jgi:hypothetical protein